MESSQRLFTELTTGRLVALLSPSSPEQCLAAWELLAAHGVVLEIAFRSEAAEEGIRRVTAAHPGALLLAGTVMTVEQAERALAAGAAGIVSADFIPEVVDLCVARDVLCIPGGLADAGKQLVRKAAGYGCTLEELRTGRPWQWSYKLFPAFAGPVSNIHLASAWRGPFRDLTVVYTGGVTLETLPRIAAADPGAIVCASALAARLDDPDRTAEEIAHWRGVLGGAPAAAATGAPAPIPERAKTPVPAAETAAAPVAAPAGEPAAGSRRPRIVTFGELMMRLSPPAGVRLRNALSFEVHFGGAAANVAASLAGFGLDARFASALPGDDLGMSALRTLRQHGIGTDHVVVAGGRMGSYFLEHGSGPRGSKVIYDRAGSSFARLQPGDLDWPAVLDGADWFHFTGISPALGDNLTAVLHEGLETARERGVRVSADLNYRSRLWSPDRAREVMTGLMPYVSLLIANEEDPEKVFGLRAERSDVEAGEIDAAAYGELAGQLIERFGFESVAITLRESISASQNRWSACLHDGRQVHHSPVFDVPVIDRVGAGDAFAAGLIYGILTGLEPADALTFGVAASCLKHSIFGDFNLVDADEVRRLAAGTTSGRVIR